MNAHDGGILTRFSAPPRPAPSEILANRVRDAIARAAAYADRQRAVDEAGRIVREDARHGR